MKWYLTSVRHYFQRIILFFSFLVIGMISLAQDKQIDVNVNTNKNNNFWGQPWVWVVGAAVFILLLVAILRSGGRKNFFKRGVIKKRFKKMLAFFGIFFGSTFRFLYFSSGGLLAAIPIITKTVMPVITAIFLLYFISDLLNCNLI